MFLSILSGLIAFPILVFLFTSGIWWTVGAAYVSATIAVMFISGATHPMGKVDYKLLYWGPLFPLVLLFVAGYYAMGYIEGFVRVIKNRKNL